jgi:adenine phosphoribosyltransferase
VTVVTAETEARLREAILEIPDFPRPGLVYRDITPILQNAELFRDVIDALAEPFENDGIEVICGIESRGLAFGAALAYRLGLGFIPIRWAGKLPRQRASKDFELEYGFDALEAHRDFLSGGRRVALVDDLLGTGKTLSACIDLVRRAGGVVACAAVAVEVLSLEGREHLGEIDLISLCQI